MNFLLGWTKNLGEVARSILLKVYRVLLVLLKASIAISTIIIVLILSGMWWYYVSTEYKSVEWIIHESKLFVTKHRDKLDKLLTSEIDRSIVEFSGNGYKYIINNKKLSVSFNDRSNHSKKDLPMTYEEWVLFSLGLNENWYSRIILFNEQEEILFYENDSPGWGNKLIYGQVYGMRKPNDKRTYREPTPWNIIHWLWIESLGKNTSDESAKWFSVHIDGPYYLQMSEVHNWYP